MESVATTANPMEKAWSKTAAGYASNVGKASSCFAQRLVELADSLSLIDKHSSVLDVGAGTGAVTLSVAHEHPECHITAVDISPNMLSVIEGFKNPNITTKVVDAVEPGSRAHKKYSHVFSSFMLQTTKTPMKVLENIYDRLEDSGVLGLAVWGPHIDPEEIWEKACQTIDPSYENGPVFDDSNAWRTPEELKEHMKKAGFEDVIVEGVSTPFAFESTNAFLEFWFNGENPAALLVIKKWKGDMGLAREAVRKICTEEYDNGKAIKLSSSLGVGRKLA